MHRRLLFLLVIFLLAISQSMAWALGDILASEYAARRSRLIALLDTSSFLVLKGAEPRVRSNDVNYPYRQESNLLYLCGTDKPEAIVLLSARPVPIDGKTTQVVLFKARRGTGKTTEHDTLNDGCILDPNRFKAVLAMLAGTSTTMYVSAPDVKFVNDWLNDRPLFFERDSRKLFEERHPGLKVKNATPLIARLREIKSPAEVGVIEKAIVATGAGLERVIRSCKPGMMEYELQADVEYEMVRRGARATGFPSIVGSGENSLNPHYEENSRRMAAGELVVVDVGAEYENYSADITRTLPVAGKFTPEQRAVYQAVLKAQRETIAIIRAGLPWKAIDKKARESISASGYGKYILHGVTHHLGIDTHDVGSFDTLRAGMVIVVEPGIYIPADDTTLAKGFSRATICGKAPTTP